MKVVTVKEMYNALGDAIDGGYGDKKILLSNDDEGNGYHECLYTLSQPEGNVSESTLPFGLSIKDAEENYIIIG